MKHLSVKNLCLVLLLLWPGLAYSQDSADESKGDFGIGIGLDYGAIGGRFAFRPSPKVALLAGLGYNLNGLGYNFGAALRLSPGKRTVPYLSAIYGYNGVIVIDGASQYNKTYYGPSVGFGLEFHSKKKTGNYFNLEMFVPFRSSEFTNDLNAIKNNPSFKLQSEPWPIAISLGYHWGF
jgi:hypothetical protein